MTPEMSAAIVVALTALATLATAVATWLRTRSTGRDVSELNQRVNGHLSTLETRAFDDGYTAGYRQGILEGRRIAHREAEPRDRPADGGQPPSGPVG